MSEHEHQWWITTHMDGCHWYSSLLVCDCGATAESYNERDVGEDLYSLVWMDGDGRDKPCVRCEELSAGAKPEQQFTVNPAAGAAGDETE